MLVDEESILMQEQEAKSNENIFFNKPGSSFLKLMQYYYDEKQLNSQPCTIKTWEPFIEKYFSSTVEMEVNVFENQKLFYRIGNLILLLIGNIMSILYVYLFVFIRKKLFKICIEYKN
jgi:hypothetical protein